MKCFLQKKFHGFMTTFYLGKWGFDFLVSRLPKEEYWLKADLPTVGLTFSSWKFSENKKTNLEVFLGD